MADNDANNSDPKESIVVTGEGGFDLAAMQRMTEEDSDDTSSDVDDDSIETLLSDPEIPKELLEAGQENVEEDDTEEVDSESDKEPAEGKTGDDREVKGGAEEVDDEAQSVASMSVSFNGKEIKVPKDGKITIPVGGKKEELTFQEVVNRASGAINIERENSALGRKKKEFKDHVSRVEADLEALSAMDDPYEIAEYIAELQGKDSTKLFEEMVEKTAQFLARRAKMTPEQVEADRQHRKDKMRLKKYESEAKAREHQETVEKNRAALETELKDLGFTLQDYAHTIDFIIEKVKEGKAEELGIDKDTQPTKDDIIDFMVEADIEKRLDSAVEKINPRLKEDGGVLKDLRRAIIKTESLTGRMSEAEVEELIKIYVQDEAKATSESLSRKARQRPNSKPANSLEQDEDDDGIDYASIPEMLGNIRNL